MRGFTDITRASAFLDPTQYRPAPPDALMGVAEAATILHQALLSGQNILVWGDFDVDGQTSTSLLVSGLRMLGEPDRIRFHVPNRFTESHGIKPEFLQKWLEDSTWKPQVLLTCDTGIAEGQAVTLAKDQDLVVIITDHHDLTPEFDGLAREPGLLWGVNPLALTEPSVRVADAIINPKFQPDSDPLRTLPGVGVAYKLIQQLFREAGIGGQERELLDLVALGIVADVAEQIHDARYLLQLGLQKLRTTQRTGLLALMDVARVSPEMVDADAIGFQIGPRMNALGRLEDANVAVELLTTTDPIRAGQLAAKMERLNQERRLLTSQITSAALEMIDRKPELLDYSALVLSHPAWHAGIVGIVASRLVEEFNRPVVLLLNPPGDAARGSARSVSGIDIGAAIAGCAHLLIGHGGHPGAAGLSLLPENIDAFRRELDRQIELNRTEDGPPALVIDAELSFEEIDLALINEVLRLAPFGNGNPTPIFVSSGIAVVEDRRIGREGNHRKFTVQQSKDGSTLPVLWFNSGDVELPPEPIDLVYSLSINEYRGERTVQLQYIDSRPSQADAGTSAVDREKRLHVYDHRTDIQPSTIPLVFPTSPRLDNQEPVGSAPAIPSPAEAAWYAEGTLLPDGVDYAPRHQIARGANALVVWTVPPSADLLLWIVEKSGCRELYLCGQQCADDSLDGVLRNVAGMCKYVLSRQKQLSLLNAASRLGTTPAAIRYSLRWLECKGLITLDEWISDDVVQLLAGGSPLQAEDRDILQAELEEQLAEVRAYRRYFRRATIGALGLG